jgi:hypothetical protein
MTKPRLWEELHRRPPGLPPHCKTHNKNGPDRSTLVKAPGETDPCFTFSIK